MIEYKVLLKITNGGFLMGRRICALLICMTLVLCLVPTARAAGSITEAGGWNETLYAILSGVTDSQITGVSYSGPVSGSLTGQDLQYLVRDENGSIRIDIPGLPAGTYKLTVTTASDTLTQSDIEVPAQDRSGYAHYGTDEGVGAYNNDGTLKDNAIVLYVTEENKNTVTVTSKDGTTVTGIGNILNSVGQDSGNGTTSKGGIANSNQDILRKLASDGTPLVVRIIGTVTAPEGLTAYDSLDYGGSVGDNGSMARMSGGLNITVEGIGTGATLDGWGLHFICQSSDYAKGYGRSFEVRNLSFRNVPEDCVGMEGQQSGSTLTAPVERCWIHNCAFYAPTIANPAESDKAGGDGACDFKRGQYFTNSYCYYEGYHKTNLVGASDSNLQFHITYHHNYWKNCESRGPLARQANIHMYNNIFEGQSSYCMNPRANAYIFSEYNLFDSCKNPVTVKSGAVKSYSDSFVNCRGSNDATVVTDKSTQVATDCTYANFDTDPSLSYIPSGDYLLQTSISEMKAAVLELAGPQGLRLTSDSNAGTEEPSTPSEFPAGTYIQDFTKSGLSSTFFTISGNLSTAKGTVTYNGLTLTRCLKIESATSISFNGPTAATLTLVFNADAAGKTIKIDGTKYTVGNDGILTVEVTAGSHTVTKGDSINLYYMVYVSHQQTHTHSYTSSVTQAATCTAEGVETYTCACGDSYTQSIPATGHSCQTVTVPATCTQAGSAVTTCENCGERWTESLPATGHSWSSASESGIRTCTVCGETWNEDLEPEGHVYEMTVLVEPTCDSEGLAAYVCTGCGDSYQTVLEATGHSYREEVTAPTCISGGYTTHTCDHCGESYQDCAVPASDNHSWGAWTAADEGQQTRVCTLCGATEVRQASDPEPDPTETTAPATPTPTQTSVGNTGGSGGSDPAVYILIGLAGLSIAVLVFVILKVKR